MWIPLLSEAMISYLLAAAMKCGWSLNVIRGSGNDLKTYLYRVNHVKLGLLEKMA